LRSAHAADGCTRAIRQIDPQTTATEPTYDHLPHIPTDIPNIFHHLASYCANNAMKPEILKSSSKTECCCRNDEIFQQNSSFCGVTLTISNEFKPLPLL